MNKKMTIILEIPIIYNDDEWFLAEDENGCSELSKCLEENFDTEVCNQIEKHEKE